MIEDVFYEGGLHLKDTIKGQKAHDTVYNEVFIEKGGGTSSIFPSGQDCWLVGGQYKLNTTFS